MASKCWFVLKQMHYPPPLLPKSGTGKMSGGGPISLGHLIPDLRHLDEVINRKGPLDIPPDMPIYPTKQVGLKFETKSSRGIETGGGVGVPIAPAIGIAIQLDAAIAFQRTVQNFWEFDSLDTFIIQPTSEFVEDSIEDEEVAAYFKKRGLFGSSTVFMITGLKVARGATVEKTEESLRSVHGDPGIGFAAVAEANASLGLSNGTGFASSAKSVTDFVWAIRLAKISKGVISREWSHSTFSSGATFSLDDDAEKGKAIAQALQSEGFLATETISVKSDEDVFVVNTDQYEDTGSAKGEAR